MPKTTTERGLGADHQRIRKALLPYAYGRQCAMCGHPMLRGKRLDADHSTPRALGGTHADRMVHATCNRKAGGRLGAALRWRGSPPAPPVALPTSRRW